MDSQTSYKRGHSSSMGTSCAANRPHLREHPLLTETDSIHLLLPAYRRRQDKAQYVAKITSYSAYRCDVDPFIFRSTVMFAWNTTMIMMSRTQAAVRRPTAVLLLALFASCTNGPIGSQLLLCQPRFSFVVRSIAMIDDVIMVATYSQHI